MLYCPCHWLQGNVNYINMVLCQNHHQLTWSRHSVSWYCLFCLQTLLSRKSFLISPFLNYRVWKKRITKFICWRNLENLTYEKWPWQDFVNLPVDFLLQTLHVIRLIHFINSRLQFFEMNNRKYCIRFIRFIDYVRCYLNSW